MYQPDLKMKNSSLELYNVARLNGTQNDMNCSKNDDFKYPLYSSVFSLVFVVGLSFNLVAIYIFSHTLKLRNETTTFMMNLIVSDSLFVLSLPFRIFYYIKRVWPFGTWLCKISVALFHTNMYSSIFFLTCISLDRFLAIVHPFRSQTIRTKRNVKLACWAVWIVVISAGIVSAIYVDTTSPSSSTHFCFENFSNKQWQSALYKVVVLIFIVGFIVPLTANVFCSVMVLRTLRKPSTISRGGSIKKAKILRMITVHLLVFCFCFIPYNLNLIFYTLVRTNVLKECYAEGVVRTIYPIALCLAVTNCCFDPVIYYFTSETIQSSIKDRSVVWHNGAKFFNRLHTESGQSTPVTTPRSVTVGTLRTNMLNNQYMDE